MKKLRVAVLANLKKNAPKWEGMTEDQWDDLDSEKTIDALMQAIRSGGHECDFLEGDITLLDTVRKYKPDICFNICEGHFGDAREAQVPAILEMLRIPYTGSKVLTLALTLDKPMTKRVLTYHDLPTPPFQVFERVDEPLTADMTFPLFVKPSREGTGMGVSHKSVVNDENEMREQIDYVLKRYKQTALVEKFIDGREVTVGIVGNLRGPVARRLPHDENLPRIQAGLHFLPPMEVDLNPYLETDAVYSTAGELEKLVAFMPEGHRVRAQDVETVRGKPPGISVFDWSEAVARGDQGRALDIVAKNLETGEAPLRMLGAFLWQMRKIWKTHELLQEGYDAGQAARQAGIPPFRAREFIQQVQRWKQSHLRRAWELFAQADSALKGGRASRPKLILDDLVIQLCRATKAGQGSKVAGSRMKSHKA